VPGSPALLALAASVLAVGPGVAARESGPSGSPTAAIERAAPAASKLSNHELAGQRIITGFDGGSVPDSLKKAIRRGRIAGVVLFSGNGTSADAVHALTKRLQGVPQPRGLRSPLLVMTDQEGGLVKRLEGPPAASAEQMGRRGSEYSKHQGRATGKLLRSAGVNIDLAPVLDVARAGGAIDSEHRAFGHSARKVARAGNAFARGLRGRGVIPTAKHFPGLGAAQVNTDDASQTIGLRRGKLREVDERPYERFRKGGRGMVMLSLAVYSAFDDKPAALSRHIALRELRHRLGFRGVSISDSLEASAAVAQGGTAKVARKAAGAGTDLLLYAHLDRALRAGDALAESLRKGTLSRGRFGHSAGRVLDLRGSLGR
jgi:beta-N-acetylhexosaminidase